MVSEINLPGGRTNPHCMDILKLTDKNMDGWKKVRPSSNPGCQSYAPAAFTPQQISRGIIHVRGLVDPRAIMRLEELSR
jgi:hypothetical protein